MGNMATGGNTKIREDIESSSEIYYQNEDTAMVKSKESVEEFIFHDEEAGIVVKFFEEELLRFANDLGGQSSREPVFGQPVKVAIMCMKEKHFKDLQISIEKIRNNLHQYHKEYVNYESKYMKTEVEEFVKRSKGNSSTLVYLDTRNEQVCVAGIKYEDVRSEVHKLKVYLGLTKMTVPRRRGTLAVTSAVDTPQPESRPVPLNPDLSDDLDRNSRTVETSRNTPSDMCDFYVEETLNSSLELKVYKASILELNVDIIVSPANGALLHDWGAAKIIVNAAGGDLERESKEYIRINGQLRVSQNCVTTAGRLKRYKGIIHAVGPEWKMYSYNKVDCLDDLYDTVTNILQLCVDRRYDSVAMPAICAGRVGVPQTLCADIYVKAAADFSKRHELYPREFHIVDIDTEILGLVKCSFERWKEDEKSIDQRRTVPDCFKVGDAAKVVIYNGTIDKVGYVDAVVVAANKNLYPGGPTATALAEAGGPSYIDALREMRKDNYGKTRNTGDVAVSKGGGLKVPNILHLVLPGGFSEKDLPVFKTVMSNVLEAAEKKYFRAIALPLIGIGGIMRKEVLLSKFCDAFVETVCAFYAKKSECFVNEIHLVNNSQQVCTALNTAFANMVDRTPINIIRDRPPSPTPSADVMKMDMDGRG